MTRTARLGITGRVQGVGYRVWAWDAARRLGLRGWVRNHRDGSVELLATGPEEAISELIEACRRGPPAARVADIAVTPAEDDGSPGFEMRPTV